MPTRRALVAFSTALATAAPPPRRGAARPQRPRRSAAGLPPRGPPARRPPRPGARAAPPRAPGGPPPGGAASWPGRPLRWLVGFPPGGAPDLLTRILAQRLEPELGQAVVVENRPGAAGNLAAAALARAAPDGLTFGTLFAATLAVNRHVYRNLPFDPRRDFTLLSEFARFPSAVMVHPSVPVSSVAELGAWMRAQAAPPICATPGAGVIPHLATEMLLRRLGARCELVHYRGNPEALRD